MPVPKNNPSQASGPVSNVGRPQSRVKKIAIVLVTVLVLILLLVFVWRVLYFSNLIRTGEINTLDTRYASNQSQSILALAPMENLGDVKLASSDDPYLGSREAKVTIVEFADFSCPYCRQSSFMMRALAARYGDQILYIYRDWPVVEMHPQALLAAQAAECAQEQNQFWQYHDKLFLNQSQQSEEDLLRYARELNMDLALFRVCLTDKDIEEEIIQDLEDGIRAGVVGTPTFFINGRRVSGAVPEIVMENLINELLSEL